MKTATERFLTYITVETTSTGENRESGIRPSTPCQKDLIDLLCAEMKEMGLKDVYVAEADYSVYGTIPANTDKALPKLGFLAHVDTAQDASGKNVKARILENYDGGIIHLNDTVFMDPNGACAVLKEVIGEDLIVTDGTTLLGADDKAGVAEIMTMAELLLHSDVPHGEVRIGFTTDEEIGEGPDLFDVEKFGCDFAYTVDGGPIGELEYENFNGAAVTVKFHGVGVHPGSAKNVMKNAAAYAAEYQMLLPQEQVPEHTEGYEGFIHLTDMKGDTVEAELRYIVRDHDLSKMRSKVKLMEATGAFLNAKYGEGTVEVISKESYYNMREKVEPHFHLIDTAAKAFTACGITPLTVPIRGGTDGAALSFKGLPCPNLSTGGYQFHGVYEFIPVSSLEMMPKVLLEIVYEYAKGEIANV